MDAPETEVPSIEVPPELVGTEDTPTFELTGTLKVGRAYGSRADVEETARLAMLSLGSPAGQDSVILEDSINVVMHGATEVGGRLEVQVTVTALAALRIDQAAVRQRIAGKTIQEAQAELEPLGEVDIALWPAWVDRLPRLEFRIDIVQAAQTPQESPPADPAQTLNE